MYVVATQPATEMIHKQQKKGKIAVSPDISYLAIYAQVQVTHVLDVMHPERIKQSATIYACCFCIAGHLYYIKLTFCWLENKVMSR